MVPQFFCETVGFQRTVHTQVGGCWKRSKQKVKADRHRMADFLAAARCDANQHYRVVGHTTTSISPFSTN
jgi:hypothetical protein